MDLTTHDRPEHPLLAVVNGALEALQAEVDTAGWGLDAAATTELVRACARLIGSVAEVEARAVAQADALGLAGAEGLKSTATWLARTTLVTQGAAVGKVRLAGQLAAHDQTRAALARGEVHVEQAVVVARSVDRLDDDETVVPVAEKQRAEKHLLGEAAVHDAHALARLGDRLFEVVDPAGADAHEARLLAAQEARARKRTRLSMRDDGEGLTSGSFAIPTAQASMLRKMLTAIAAPKSIRAAEGAGSYDHQKPSAAKLGEAFVKLVERVPASLLPRLGGLSATVIVIGDADILTGKVKAAELDTGVRISHEEMVRMACEAGVIPAWMDTTDGKVLSLGRRKRFHQDHQRLALVLERRGCEHPGCTTPAYLCHAHHNIAWHAGGETDVATAVLLCPFHHHRAHATGATYPLRT